MWKDGERRDKIKRSFALLNTEVPLVVHIMGVQHKKNYLLHNMQLQADYNEKLSKVTSKNFCMEITLRFPDPKVTSRHVFSNSGKSQFQGFEITNEMWLNLQPFFPSMYGKHFTT